MTRKAQGTLSTYKSRERARAAADRTAGAGTWSGRAGGGAADAGGGGTPPAGDFPSYRCPSMGILIGDMRACQINHETKNAEVT